jgi:hypothetical protein
MFRVLNPAGRTIVEGDGSFRRGAIRSLSQRPTLGSSSGVPVGGPVAAVLGFHPKYWLSRRALQLALDPYLDVGQAAELLVGWAGGSALKLQLATAQLSRSMDTSSPTCLQAVAFLRAATSRVLHPSLGS